MDQIDSLLLKDLDRLTKRVNSEEGVPMFLACEDLAPPGVVAEKSKNLASRVLNDEFVFKFCRDAEFVQNSGQDAPLYEIAKIVERLAERDFALAATERNS